MFLANALAFCSIYLVVAMAVPHSTEQHAFDSPSSQNGILWRFSPVGDALFTDLLDLYTQVRSSASQAPVAPSDSANKPRVYNPTFGK
jgi:hypothetical protein